MTRNDTEDARAHGTPMAPVADPNPPEFSDEALALKFAEQHSHSLRYVAKFRKWIAWDGTRWKRENTLLALSHARTICRSAAAECNDPNVAKRIASAATISAVERLARADRRLAATADQWDLDPWLLNTPNGCVDLRTNMIRKHNPEDYLTRITAVSPQGECPLWHKFLRKITDNYEALISFLQRVFGYALTGSTREQALFFLYGPGSNGKTTMLNAVAGCLGEYHRAAPIETFTASMGYRHPTELAGLQGARFVTAAETEQELYWDESRVKMLTGGDRISARLMRADFFDFTAQFKLFFAGNHKPKLRSVDEAIRRRINLIPMLKVILQSERDDTLPDKLKKEAPGILKWMLQGCVDWQHGGLRTPDVVRKATDEYFLAEDTFASWLHHCGIQDRNSWASSTALFKSWEGFANGEARGVGTQMSFSLELEKRGFEKNRKSGGQGFKGLRLKDQ